MTFKYNSQKRNGRLFIGYRIPLPAMLRRRRIVTNLTPDVLHKFFPSVSDLCWRCSSACGTLLHLWWECPTILNFWITVHTITAKVTSCRLPFTLACLLLNHVPEDSTHYYKSAVIHKIGAAKKSYPGALALKKSPRRSGMAEMKRPDCGP